MSDPQTLWFAFRGSELLVLLEEAGARVPSGREWEALGLSVLESQSIGVLEGSELRAAGLSSDVEPPEGTAFQGLRRLWGVLDEEVWKLAGRAVQLVEWDRNHRFCGRCGAETERQTAELARVCPRFAPGVYSTLAGFVEPGESLEDTVVREVREEVGVEVTNVRYFGSQPWPFPNSLMIGFVAEYAAGELRLQEGEIEDAGWFTVDNLPGLPSPYSIARALLEEFIASRRRP